MHILSRLGRQTVFVTTMKSQGTLCFNSGKPAVYQISQSTSKGGKNKHCKPLSPDPLGDSTDLPQSEQKLDIDLLTKIPGFLPVFL